MHMKVARTIFCASIATVPLLCGANVGIEVWAINDSVRIDPIRNQPFEDNQKLFPGDMRHDYKNSNLIWDGAPRRIMLKAARRFRCKM